MPGARKRPGVLPRGTGKGARKRVGKGAAGKRVVKKRNPIARELATGKFRPRVVERTAAYKRKAKHKLPPEAIE
jgi:hypothetical protein